MMILIYLSILGLKSIKIQNESLKYKYKIKNKPFRNNISNLRNKICSRR